MNDCGQEFKSFSTSRKKTANSPVRKRCIEFTDAMHALGFSCMPLDDAKELFIATLGICDRASLKAYFGTQPHRSIQNIHRMARYQSGCVSMKNIQLMRKIEHVAGYFELLRIAIIERKGTAWFFTLNESGVVSEFENKSVNSCGKTNILKISLSPVCKDEQHEQPFAIRVDGDRGEREGGSV